ncbi:hypothetical protein QTP88_009336 [Uroleucon formosanum]
MFIITLVLPAPASARRSCGGLSEEQRTLGVWDRKNKTQKLRLSFRIGNVSVVNSIGSVEFRWIRVARPALAACSGLLTSGNNDLYSYTIINSMTVNFKWQAVLQIKILFIID